VRVLRWADAGVDESVVARLVAAKLGWRVTSFADVHGDDAGEEAALIEKLAAEASATPILVVAESFEPPSKSIQRLLRSVRERVGARVPIVVGLCGGTGAQPAPRADDVRIWRRRITQLGDPWLRVETLA